MSDTSLYPFKTQEPLASSALEETLVSVRAPQRDILAPIPSSSSIPAFRSTSTLTPVVCDERAIGRLLGTILQRSGLSIEEVSRRMGVTSNTIRQYLAGRRNRPSLLWFVKVAGLCGATVTIEFPQR